MVKISSTFVAFVENTNFITNQFTEIADKFYQVQLFPEAYISSLFKDKRISKLRLICLYLIPRHLELSIKLKEISSTDLSQSSK